MAGEATVIRILPKKRYKLTKTATNEAYTYSEYLGKQIDVRKFRDGTLMVRCHYVKSCNSGDTATVQAYHDGYSDEDPGLEFFGGTIGSGAVISFTGTAANDFPAVNTNDLGASGAYFSALLAVKLTIAHTATASDLEFDLSVDLVLRN